jgi:DNA-binding NarL/FixJ family response regulator
MPRQERLFALNLTFRADETDKTMSPTIPVNPVDTPVSLWLIEDDPLFRESLVRLFDTVKEIDCQHAFVSFEEALETIVDEFAPEILLTDLELPGISGIEGARRVSELSPHTRVIVLSVHQDDNKIFDAICAGATGYLLKPSSKEAITRAILSARHGGAPINPAIAEKVLDRFRKLSLPTGNYNLSKREHEILAKLVEGDTKASIAEALFLSFHTVDMHVRNIYSKLQVHSRGSAVAKAVRERLL